MANLSFRSWLEVMTGVNPVGGPPNPQNMKTNQMVNQAVTGVLKKGGDAAAVKKAVNGVVTTALQSGQMQAKDINKYVGDDMDQKPQMMKKKMRK